MALEPPLMELPIKTAKSGFYRGFSIDVTITAKGLHQAFGDLAGGRAAQDRNAGR